MKSDQAKRYTVDVAGTTSVTVYTPGGLAYNIRDVGIGHPWHTISEGGGRVSTAAEQALAKALMERSEEGWQRAAELHDERNALADLLRKWVEWSETGNHTVPAQVFFSAKDALKSLASDEKDER